MEPFFLVLREDVAIYGDALYVTGMIHREGRDADHHDLGSQGNGFFPMRKPVVTGQERVFFFEAIGYDFILIGSGDEEVYGCLIRWVIHAGQPVVCPVGPVVPEKSTVSEFVGGDDEAVGGYALVDDGVSVEGEGGGAW